jgi:hypothetical protein
MIERHFGEAVDAGLVGSRLFAAVVERKDFALDRRGPRLVGKPLRARGRRQQHRGDQDQERLPGGGSTGAGAQHDWSQQAKESRPTHVRNESGERRGR